MEKEARIEAITGWLNGPRDFTEGMDLLRRLIPGGSTSIRGSWTRLRHHTLRTEEVRSSQMQKLIHALSRELKRLQDITLIKVKGPEVIKEIPRVEFPVHDTVKDKIQKYLNGPQNFQQGIELIESMPEYRYLLDRIHKTEAGGRNDLIHYLNLILQSL